MISNPKWWVGKVEDRFDPERRGRIRVRIFGVHTESLVKDDEKGQGIPIEDLPWAMVAMPLTYGGVPSYGTVAPPGVLEGAWVVGFSLDGDAFNQLLVTGVLPIGALSDVATNPNNSWAEDVVGSVSSFLGIDAPDAEDTADGSTKSDEFYVQSIQYTEAMMNGTSTQDVPQMVPEVWSMNLQEAMQDPEIKAKITESTGLDIDADSMQEKLLTDTNYNKVVSEGIYTYLLGVYGDPTIAALAYNRGMGETNDILSELGDPTSSSITNEELANKLISTGTTGGIDAGNYMIVFMDTAGE